MKEALNPSEWNHIPSEWLRAELVRRKDEVPQPACGSASKKGSYNTPLHVAALFIILVLSTFACSFPIIVRRFPKLRVPHRFLFVSRHFGTGVLIATAFVHLLPTAFVSLTDPCLPPLWNQGYPAMAGLIAMASVLVVVGIEMFFATRGAGHVHSSSFDDGGRYDDSDHFIQSPRGPVRVSHARRGSLRPFRHGNIRANDHAGGVAMRELPASSEHLMGGQTPELAQSPVFQKGARHEDEESEDGDLDSDEMDHTARLLRRMSQESGDQRHSEDEGHKQNRRRSAGSANGNADRAHEMRLARRPSVQVMEQQQQRKMLLQCLLLEAGILFHSVFIGMALSVATGTSFIVLLVAISFHQTFEGIALGSRIAAITSLPPTSPKPWLMALAYGTTTPFGQAIGLLVHNLYDPASQTGLLLVGLMNAISSGLLLFAGLVELLAEDFLSDKSYETLKGRKRIEACGAVVGGAMLMAFVGAFA